MPAIKANNIEKYYQSADKELVHALDNISLTVNDGEFVAIVGPSGCGKSTFLEIVAGLLSADGGEIYLDDEKITGTSRDIGVVFQDASLFPWKTIKKNIAYGMEIAKVPKAKLSHAAISALPGFLAPLANALIFPSSFVSRTTLLSYSPIGPAAITMPVTSSNSAIS